MTPEQRLEALAAQEHERWSGWQQHLHGLCRLNADGSLTIPAERAHHWRRLINTPYAELPEHSKEADRKEARKTLSLLAALSVVKDRQNEAPPPSSEKPMTRLENAAIVARRHPQKKPCPECANRRKDSRAGRPVCLVCNACGQGWLQPDGTVPVTAEDLASDPWGIGIGNEYVLSLFMMHCTALQDHDGFWRVFTVNTLIYGDGPTPLDAMLAALAALETTT